MIEKCVAKKWKVINKLENNLVLWSHMYQHHDA